MTVYFQHIVGDFFPGCAFMQVTHCYKEWLLGER